MVRDDFVFRYGLQPAAIRVIRNGTDLQRFRPPQPASASRFARAVAGSGRRGGALPRHRLRAQGLEPAFRALALLAPGHPELRLLVAVRIAGSTWSGGPRARHRGPRALLGPARIPSGCSARRRAAAPTAYDPRPT